MYQEEIQNYYSRKDIQKAILEISENREIVPTLYNGNFGIRPNALFYEKDIEHVVKQGVVSFHGSVERWRNPLALSTTMKKEQLDELRTGWDLIIDIDCSRTLDYAKKAAKILVDALENYGIKTYSIKFSGNRGFHIGMPFEIFPESIDYKPMKNLFPRVPKLVIEYLKFFIEKDLRAEFQENPKNVLTLDSAVISSRHLFRLPYCLHNKTWLVSIPLKKDELESFEREMAKPDKIKTNVKFLEAEPGKTEPEGTELLQSALFWGAKNQKEKTADFEGMKIPEAAIKPEYFPPCIKNILNGIEDGRKRSIFILIGFLHHIGWKQDEIRSMLYVWNQKNKPALRENLISITLTNQYSARKSPQMAPSCNNLAFYKDFGVCTPDEFCKKISNPVTYTLGRVRGLRKAKGIKRRAMKREVA